MPLAVLALAALQETALPDFPAAWKTVPATAGSASQIAGAAPGAFAAVGTRLTNFAVEREMRFSVSLRGQDASKPVEINSFAYGEGGKLLKSASTPVALKAGEWVMGSSTLVAPRGTKAITLFFINDGPKPVDVKDPGLALGEVRISDVRGGGLLRASAGMPVEGGAGTVTFPVPGPTAEAVPVSFVLRSAPPTALKGYTVRRRAGDDWVCEAQVAPAGGGRADLRWESLIAVRDLPAAPLPKVKIGLVEAALKPWLASTPVVQAADPAIRKKALELRKASPDLETFARKVIAFTSGNEGTGKPFVALDASSALGCGGSCTSRANLGAALLRAGGVPARTVSHLPTFADGSLLYEHWLTEYWHPGAGWVRLETTMGEFRPPATGFVTLATASIDDERRTGAPGQLGWIMPGAAWMSGIQGAGGLRPTGSDEEGNANWCRPERRMPVEAVMKAARAAWPRLATGHPELAATAAKATPEALAKALGEVR